MTRNNLMELLQQVLDEFNAHDLDAIMSHFSDDCVFDSARGPNPWGQRFSGKEETRRGLGIVFESTPDLHFSNVSHFVSGSRGVSEWNIMGTTTQGESLGQRGCDLWTFRDDGLIVRKTSFRKQTVT